MRHLRRYVLPALSIILAFPSFYSAVAQPAPPPHERGIITVQGDGRSQAKPDYAAINADVATIASSLEVANRQHRERAAKAEAALKAIEGLTIESSTFRLDRTIPAAPAGQKPPAPEFHAVTSFSLKTKNVANIDDIIGKLAASGLIEIHNLSFALNENSSALDTARRNAVLDARHRAEIYADAAGVKLGEVIEISDGERRYPMALKQAGYARGMAVTPPETLDVNASVTMSWRIRP